MDPQLTGRQLHRYRGRIVALEAALRQARIWVEEAGAAGNEHAPRVLARIDKALGKEQLPCEQCQATHDLLAPTMAGAKADSVMVMMPAATMHQVFENATRGTTRGGTDGPRAV